MRHMQSMPMPYQECAFTGDPRGVCLHREGSDVTLITYGNVVNNVLSAAELLAQKGVSAKVLRLLSASDLPDLREKIVGPAVIIEEAAEGSGIKEALAWQLPGVQVHGIDLGGDFVPHGDQNSLYKLTGLDAGSITKFVCEVLHHEE